MVPIRDDKGGVMMNRLRWIGLMVLFLFFPTLSYPASLENLRIRLIEGDVQVNTEDTEGWVPASLNVPLTNGDRIWVPEGGRAELQLRDGTLLRLDQKTAFDILTLDRGSYQFYLSEGRAYANFKGNRGSLLQIDSPLSSIRAYERALFEIHILDDRHTDVSVFQGSVYVESQDGRVRVDSDKTLALSEGAPGEIYPLGPPDDWERWNQERDRLVAQRRPPSRYLPEELHPYSNDLDDHGRWIYVREYGHVWTPTIVVSVGWAPYRVGRWVWIRGDYVWISYEPWGWVPYHYGRWAFVPRVGWCWVPPPRGAVFWGPGFVGWVRTPTYVSWVPLAPREIYYGYGYYGPYSVNITQVNISTIHVEKVVYKNVRVQNAVTIVHHDTFVHGRRVDITVRENPFLKERIHIGRPNIKPEKATVMPVVREIPHGKRPPEKINEIRVREIKERRPLAKEPEASVLRPGSPPREMEIKRKEARPQERRPGRREERPREKAPQIEPKSFPKEAERPTEPPREERKPVEPKPIEKGRERIREAPTPPGRIEKPQESRPQEKPTEKAIEKIPQPPAERPREERKPVEPKPIEKGRERIREAPTPPGRIEKPQEFKPQDRPIEKTIERGPQAPIERPREDRKSLEIERERERERTRERSSSDRGRIPVRERESQQPPETSRPQRDLQIEREVRQERGMEIPQKTRSTEREAEKIQEVPSREGEGFKSSEPGNRRGASPSGRGGKQ